MKRFKVFENGIYIKDAVLYRNGWAFFKLGCATDKFVSTGNYLNPDSSFIECWEPLSKKTWWQMFHDYAYTVEEV